MTLQRRPRGAATAAQLAAELGVSVRTIHRDLAALRETGVPLWTEPGPRGGVRLVEGWRTRLDGMTGDEAAALFLSGAPGVAGDLGLGTVLLAAQSKVLATLPPESRARADRARGRFHVDAPGWFHRDEPVPHLAAIADGVWRGRRLDIRYARRDREVARRLDPLGLVLKAGTWYLVARHRSDIRSYRVGRVVRAVVLDEPVVRPPDFDLASWWERSNEDFARSLMRFTCVLRLSPAGLRLLPHVVDPYAGRRAVAGAAAPDASGWVVVELAGESEDVVADQLCALGARVEVLEPRTLRAKLAATARETAARNA